MDAIMGAGTIVTKVVVPKGIDIIMKKYIQPRWNIFQQDRKRKDKLNQAKPDIFAEYFVRSYESHCYMRTMAFGNRKELLKDLYVPITLCDTYYNGNSNPNGKSIIKVVESAVEYFLFDKIMLIDTAGMGKTTLMNYIFLEVMEQGFGIPILIELRNLNKNETILEKILNDLQGFTENIFDMEILKEFIHLGDFIFFFDGYDEISESERGRVSMEIADFVSKAGTKNTFFLSSREIEGLDKFSDFKRYSIKPLEINEALDLIRKYGKEDEEIAEELIHIIHNGGLNEMLHFLENPLLVSLLFRAYYYKRELPVNKSSFYRQVYDALFDGHDIGKSGEFHRDKKSGLNKEEFYEMLSRLGYWGYFKYDKVSYQKTELIKLIDECKTNLIECYKKKYLSEQQMNRALSLCPEDLIEDLLYAVPIFQLNGLEYQWVHKSYQEYFAASFINMSSNKEKLLERLANRDDGVVSIIDFYYDIDPGLINSIFIVPTLKEVVDYYNRVKGKYGEEFEYEILANELALANGKDMDIAVGKIDRKISETCLFIFSLIFLTKNYKNTYLHTNWGSDTHMEIGYAERNFRMYNTLQLAKIKKIDILTGIITNPEKEDEIKKRLIAERKLRLSVLEMIKNNEIEELKDFISIVRGWDKARIDIKKAMQFIKWEEDTCERTVSASENPIDFI